MTGAPLSIGSGDVYSGKILLWITYQGTETEDIFEPGFIGCSPHPLKNRKSGIKEFQCFFVARSHRFRLS
jgi:hypothetical protein